MEDNLENKLGMFQKVQGTLALHAADTAAVPAVAALSGEFDDLVNEILATATTASIDITGYTVDKQAKRTELKTGVLKLSGAIVAHTALTNDFRTIEKCDATPNQLDYMRDSEFYLYANLVIEVVTPIVATLAPYGIVPADLTAAKTAATNFLKVIQAPKTQINERSEVKNELEGLFAKTSDFLDNKLDKVMGIFMTTNPLLYNLYKGARSIDNTGAAADATYQNIVAANVVVLVAELPYLPSRSFKFENTGSVPLSFALSATANTLEGEVLLLQPGATSTRSTSTLNTNPLATKLYVRNADLVVGGSYKIWMEE